MNREMSVDGKCAVCGKGGVLRHYAVGMGDNPKDVRAVAHSDCWKKIQNGKAKPLAWWKHTGTYSGDTPELLQG